jgi:glycosyltransferase involved in cell wall biosynthesis/uncharacterized membrane protein YczE
MHIGIMLRHYDQHQGGVRVYTRRLLAAMLELRSPHEFIFLYKNPALVGSYRTHPQVQELVVGEKESFLQWDQVAVPKAVRRCSIDVLFNPKYSIPLSVSCPTVWVCHGLDWYVMPWASRRVDRLSHRFLVPQYAAKADAIIAVSEITRQQVIQFLRVAPDRVHTIYHGVDDAFREQLDEATLQGVRQRYGLPPRYFLYVGMIYPPKNFTRLIQAYAKVGPDLGISLFIAGGENRFLSEHELEVPSQLGLQAWVKWAGWIDAPDLCAVYQMAEALLLPSLFESFGLPIIEAMASGCPVVTSDRHGTKEICAEAAVLVDPEQVDAIAEGMRRIVADSALRTNLIERGKMRAQDFRWKHCASETLKLLESLPAAATEPAGQAVRPIAAAPIPDRLAPEIVAGRLAIAGLAAAAGLVQRLGAKLAELEYAIMAAGASRGQWLQRLLMSLAGCLFFSLGVKLYIDADLGTDPLHSMLIGATDALDLPYVGVGLAESIITGAFLALWSAWNQRLPPLSTFITMALVGYLVDFWNLIGLERYTTRLEGPTAMMLTGVLLHAYASALIVMSGIGIRVMDLVAISMVRHWGWSFLRGKLSIEAGFFAVAWLVGGPIGPGTVAFLAVVGCLVPSFMWANERLLQLPNYVLCRSTGSHA